MLTKRKPRRGTVAVLTAVCLTGLLGFAALSLDAALLLQDRRAAQAAADSAALAAAGNLFANWRTNQGQDPAGAAANDALAAAAANGFSNDGVNSLVTVNIPPLSGDHIGQAGYVEVIVQQFQQRAFSAVWTGPPAALVSVGGAAPTHSSTAVSVQARAVARGMWVPHNVGILVLDPASSGSLTSNGGSSVTTNAKIIVDSNSPSATVVTGGGALTTPELDVTGVPGTSTSGGGAINATIMDSQVPTPDPLAYLPEPDPTNMSVQSTKTVKLQNQGSLSLLPGVYQGGINVTGGNLTLASGIYYMDGGGFSFSGTGSLTADGVMIVNAPQKNSDVIGITGTGAINISPMTTGLYQGISFWQTRTSTNTLTVSGGGSGSITGTFYAQHGTLKVSGGGGSSVGSQYISWDVSLSGNGNFGITWSPDAVAPEKDLQLVE
jgi:Flp pilus assembly protein TadG